MLSSVLHRGTLLWRSAGRSMRAISSAQSYILVDHREDGVTIVSLNRVDGKNSMSKAMVKEFRDVIEELKDDTSIRAVVLKSSVPKVFCAGADLKERKTMNIEEVADFVTGLRTSFSSWEALPMPTIAAIEGAALGGGLELALCCDLRVAASDAVIGLPETGLAIIPGAGGTQRLPRLIGPAKAKEVIFGGKRYDGKTAEALGIVNESVPSGEAEKRALEIAEGIAKNGPIAIRMAKAAIDGGLQVDLPTGLLMEKECYAQVIHTEDRNEGLLAFAEKRTPSYKGR